jgi:hypothetical protein
VKTRNQELLRIHLFPTIHTTAVKDHGQVDFFRTAICVQEYQN